jgi:hypothetical protein
MKGRSRQLIRGTNYIKAPQIAHMETSRHSHGNLKELALLSLSQVNSSIKPANQRLVADELVEFEK